jgi:hypothetical protein
MWLQPYHLLMTLVLCLCMWRKLQHLKAGIDTSVLLVHWA